MIDAAAWRQSQAINAAIERRPAASCSSPTFARNWIAARLRHLVANFADPSIGAVSGRMRLLRAGRGEQADMDLYWRYEVWARQQHSNIDSIFSTTGCIYAMRRDSGGPIPPDTLSDDAMFR